ncbi:hypothetical protein NBZ79_12575 [Sneathiella marina]|uniref:Uncharacterized protein n=1 Tax=Sneathiella marina TaxID=2950108 RepID=A0ABY4VYL1_9PROT|nr:hypothetical protein [Sneathiella marina]USG60013.1 hypothetical protein NBZ79_12575 [Sneathiella marina]
MVSGILTGAPLWVWPLLGVLLYLGFRATKPRQAPVFLFYCLPLLGVISLNTVSSLPHQAVVWGCFGAGYLIGVISAYPLQGKWLVGKQGTTVSLTGEWFTMLTLMIIFWMNFAGGVTQAISPQIYSGMVFMVVFTLVTGWASGCFLGRALKVIQS